MSEAYQDQPNATAAASGRFSEPLAWLSSLAMHACALICLAVFTQIAPLDKAPLLFTSPPPEEPEPLDDAFRVSEELSIDIGALSDGGVGDAAASAPLEAVVPEVALDLQALTELGQIPTLEASTPSLSSPDPNSNTLVIGVGAVGTTGSEGAIDWLTGAILQSLEQSPTVVVWLFDRSESLTAQREEIVRRFDRVYEELGVAATRGAEGFDAAEEDEAPLLTSIVAFGEGVEFVTRKPTADIEAIKEAVRSIEPDESGAENVFGAVLSAAERHKRYRLQRPRRNVMLVVVTDEAGDDFANIDRAVAYCRKMQMPVYAVGAPAPFGRRETYVRYVDPDPKYDQTPQYLPVQQGPETLFPERLRLGSFAGDDYDGTILDSGFGPYALTRLTRETNGSFIAVHPFRVDAGRANRRGADDTMVARLDYFFDQRVMRRYLPDYVPTTEYQKRVSRNGAKRALVEASAMAWTEKLENVRRDFPKLDEAQFAEDLSNAQRAAAILEPKLAQLVTTLRRGEADRPKIDDPRWQAGYDLALGQALAAKVRAEGYNAMLALAKQGLSFTSEKKDTWVIRPAEEISTGSLDQREAEDAIRYLKRVVAEHEGTPWAFLAQRELSTPLGWKWNDEFRNLAERRQQENNRPPRPERPEPPPKPRRTPKL
ncbi:vWA domain-containing protein [Botrimarina mediterranea]|uniref:VWFA domain-containing protein n=1 Tax=Botrimarina mediterranea TaxID=2528022 RepID=A0A518KAX3_9BACT|nr:vWA domain-containing protein [Botrimarina mediterranea]QDV74937.1 hypothetical protein Spa11_31460 [Botrimarina mediterranea]